MEPLRRPIPATRDHSKKPKSRSRTLLFASGLVIAGAAIGVGAVGVGWSMGQSSEAERHARAPSPPAPALVPPADAGPSDLEQHLRRTLERARRERTAGQLDEARRTFDQVWSDASIAGFRRESPEARLAAEARLDNVPAFVRPMARTGIERFARENGADEVDEKILDAAREFFGM